MSLFLGCVVSVESRTLEVIDRIAASSLRLNLGKLTVKNAAKCVVLAQQAEYDQPEGTKDYGPPCLVGEVNWNHTPSKRLVEHSLPLVEHRLSPLWTVYEGLLEDGENAPNRFTNEFAYVWWDQSSQSLIAARDRIGGVPLYHASQPSGLWVSNSLSWLLWSMPERLDLNHRRLVRKALGLLDEGTVPTDYQGVSRVPSGHLIRASRDGSSFLVSVRRYSTLGEDKSVPVSQDHRENARTLQQLLRKSVITRIPSSGLVGAELSGGLDSSSISGLAAEVCRDRLVSCSALFPGFPESDEKEFIDAAVRHQHIVNHQFSAPDLDIASAFRRSIDISGGLHTGANVHVNLHILDRLRDIGAHVVLNGIDGDNVASHGFFRLRELAENADWQSFSSEVTSVADILSRSNRSPAQGLFKAFGRDALDRQSATKLQWKHLQHLYLIARATGISFFGLLRRAVALRLLGSPEMAFRSHQVSGQVHLINNDLMVHLATAGGGGVSLQAAQPENERENQLSILMGGVTERFFELIHPLAAQARVSARSPFMDIDVIEFCLNVPASHKLRDGWNRWILRAGLEQQMGTTVAWRRSKSDFSHALVPFVKNRVVPELLDWIESPNLAVWDVNNREAVSKLVNDPSEGNLFRNQFSVFSVWAMGVFLERFEQLRRAKGSGA